MRAEPCKKGRLRAMQKKVKKTLANSRAWLKVSGMNRPSFLLVKSVSEISAHGLAQIAAQRGCVAVFLNVVFAGGNGEVLKVKVDSDGNVWSA